MKEMLYLVDLSKVTSKKELSTENQLLKKILPKVTDKDYKALEEFIDGGEKEGLESAHVDHCHFNHQRYEII